MFGTAKATDPTTGRFYDDTVPMVKAIKWLSDADREKIFCGNAKRLYTRAKFQA
jgi:4-oxalmesaconate hydratase